MLVTLSQKPQPLHIAAMAGEDEQEFRRRCTEGFNQAEALDVMIVSLENIAVSLREVGK